jgi:hypothetical protein
MTGEDFKGATHAFAASLFAIMAAYNALRWVETKQRKNLTNVALYGPMALYEWSQVRHHWGKRDAA